MADKPDQPADDDMYGKPTPRQQPFWDAPTVAPLPDEAGFTASEHWAWHQIIRGEMADMAALDGDSPHAGADLTEVDDPNAYRRKALKPWPETRKLSARFLRTILLHEPWRSAKAVRRVRIRNAWIEDEFALTSATIIDELWLDASRIDGALLWAEARFRASVSLEGSRLAAGLQADRMRVDGSLFCDGDFVSDGKVELLRAHIGGQVGFSGAALERGLTADGLRVDGGLFCRDGFVSRGDVRLLGAHISGNAEFDGATLECGLNADSLRVDGGLFCRGGFVSKGEIDLVRAHIGGHAQLRGAFSDLVDLTGATIGGELQFDQGGEHSPTWSDGARLILRNVSAGAFAGGLDSLKMKPAKTKFVRTDLQGLTYQRIGGLQSVKATKSSPSLATADSKDLIDWLRSDAPVTGPFTPQPYRQLADALDAVGAEGKAKDVRRGLFQHEREADTGVPRLRKVSLVFNGVFVGYGYRSYYALAWFAAAIVVAILAAITLAPGAQITSVRDALAWGSFGLDTAIPLIDLNFENRRFLGREFPTCSPAAPGLPPAFPGGPITPPARDCNPQIADLPGGVGAVFSALRLAGFVIISYLVAGVTGLASAMARRA